MRTPEDVPENGPEEFWTYHTNSDLREDGRAQYMSSLEGKPEDT
jgi:hypothetical protein